MIKVKLNKKLLTEAKENAVQIEDFTNSEIFFIFENFSDYATKLNRNKVKNTLNATQKDLSGDGKYTAFKNTLKSVIVDGELNAAFINSVKDIGGIKSEPDTAETDREEPIPDPEPESGEDDGVEDYEDDEPTERVPVDRDDTEEDTEDVGLVNNQLEMGQKSIEPYIDLFIQENSEEVQKFKNTNNGDALLNSFIGWHGEPKAVTQQIRRFQNVLEAHTSQGEESTLGGFILDYIKDKNNISEELRILTVSQFISLLENEDNPEDAASQAVRGKDKIYQFLVTHFYFYLTPQAAVKVVKDILNQYRGEQPEALEEDKSSRIRTNFDHLIRSIAAIQLSNETLTEAEFADDTRRGPDPTPRPDDEPDSLNECEHLLGPEMSRALNNVVKDQNLLGKAARLFANLSLACDAAILANLGASFFGVSLPFTIPGAVLSGAASTATSAIAAGLNLINGQTTEAIFNAIGAIPIVGKIGRLFKSLAKAKILRRLLKFPAVQKMLKFMRWAKSARQSLNISNRIIRILIREGVPPKLAKLIAQETSDIFFKQVQDRVKEIEQEAFSAFKERTGVGIDSLEDLENYVPEDEDQEISKETILQSIDDEKQRLIEKYQECLSQDRRYKELIDNSDSFFAGVVDKMKQLLPDNLLNLLSRTNDQLETGDSDSVTESIILEYIQEYEASLLLSEQKDNYDVRMLQLAGIK